MCRCASGGGGTSASRCADVANLSVRLKHRNLPLTVGINQSQRQNQRECSALHISLPGGELVHFLASSILKERPLTFASSVDLLSAASKKELKHKLT